MPEAARSTIVEPDAAVVTKAALRAAARLSLSSRTFARIIGVSEATASRMGKGTHVLSPGDKPFELAVLFVRLYRSLDALVGGDEAAARAWLRGHNDRLGAAPLALIQTVPGLFDVLSYLDARRARL